MRYLLSLLIGACLLASGCTEGTHVENERAALLDRDRSWAAVIASGDVDRVFSYWADDAVIYAAGIPAVRGKEAIRKFVATNRTQRGFSLTTLPREAVVSQDGNLGYTVGEYEIFLRGPEGSPIVTEGRYLAIWRRDSAGLWKCTLEIHSPLDTVGRPDLRPNESDR